MSLLNTHWTTCTYSLRTSHSLPKQSKIPTRPHSNSVLLELLDKENQRIRFRQACGFYCSHLINLGYSKHYIDAQNKHHFMLCSHQKAGRPSLSRFFKSFDGELKNYIVIAAISRDFGRYLGALEFPVKAISAVPVEQAKQIISDEVGNDALALERKVKEYDPYSAMMSVHEELVALRALTYLDPVGMRCCWGETMWVTRVRAVEGEPQRREELNFSRSPGRPTSGRRRRSIQKFTERVLDNFDDELLTRVLSSITTGALAQTTANMENQLISLWAAVEVMLRDPPPGTPRIVHYTGFCCHASSPGILEGSSMPYMMS